MWVLLQENVRYLIRSRMIILVLLFSALVHYSVFKLVNHIPFSVGGDEGLVGPHELVQVALYLELFTSLCIASVFGVWMAPYAHRGSRALLTHVLPVSKMKFSYCYVLCCAILMLINKIVSFLICGWVIGYSALLSHMFSWQIVLKVWLFQTICLEVLMLGLAVSSLVLGQVMTIFLGASFLFVMQIIGTLFRLLKEEPNFSAFTPKGLLVFIFSKLPPVGDLIIDFHSLLKGRGITQENLILWCTWFVVVNLIFWFKIRYPAQIRSTEA